MKIQNILANEMVLLGGALRLDPILKIEAARVAKRLQAGVVTDWGSQPHIKICPRRARNFKYEIGRIARDIPVDAFRCACFTEPFTQFIARFRLCELRNPAPQESLALRIGEAEKIVRCGFAHGRRAGEYG